MPFNRIMLWATIGLTIFFGLLFVYHWRAGYSSDTILTGLMAKNVIARGERPIFLWHFGYHGVIPNVYVTALFFKLFGVSPQVNLLFTLLTYWTLMAVIFRYIDNIWGRRIALFTVLALLVSSSELYTKIMRSEPGYTEIFLCGMLTLLWSRNVIKRLYVERASLDRRTLFYIAGASFCAGFGYYIYELTAYFIAVLAAQLAVMALRDAARNLRWKTPMDCAVIGIVATGGLVFVDGLWAFARKSSPMLPNFGLPASTLAHIGAGLAMSALGVGVDVSRRHAKALLGLWPVPLAIVGGTLAGLSPKLYFKYVQHGVSLTKTGLDENVDMFIQRLKWAWQTDKFSMNVSHDDLTSQVVLTAWVVVLVAFGAREVIRWYRFVAGRSERNDVLTLDPLGVLPWAVLPAYGLSAAVYDSQGARYTVVLFLYFALAAGWAIHWAVSHSKVEWHYAGWAAAAFLAIFNGRAIVSELNRWESQGFDGEDVLQALKDRKIHFGYAEYWASYAITFYSDEDIILQPLFSAYAPAYGPIVAQADRLAIVERARNIDAMRLPPVINGRPMHVVDTFKGREFGFVVVEKNALGLTATDP